VKSKSKDEEIFDFPAEKGDTPWNFSESASLYHEVKYMEDAIKAGKTESSVLGLDESLQVLKLTDEIRKQIGLVFPWDPK